MHPRQYRPVQASAYCSRTFNILARAAYRSLLAGLCRDDRSGCGAVDSSGGDDGGRNGCCCYCCVLFITHLGICSAKAAVCCQLANSAVSHAIHKNQTAAHNMTCVVTRPGY